jgi:glycosyltransferase involved in cell wall biosynthesis
MSLIASASVHWLWVEWAATGICWLVAFAWLARAAEAFVMLKRVPDLRALPEPPSFITSSVGDTQPSGAADAHCPLLSVIVPGCNEEVSIDATVRSLLASRGLPVEVIAVDDRSTDGTGAILDQLLKEFAAENVQLASNRLKVLHIRALPQGWLGKPHALAQGVALATAPYLLFTDADILFQEDALLRALGFLIEQRLDHLVLASTPISRSVGERMMLSTLQVIGVWPVRLWKISDPEARDSIGVGSFGLVRRETLDQIGGWQKLRMEVLEDLRFGWEVKRGHHLRQQVAVGRDLLRLHWAAGAIGIAHNLTKNGFALFEYCCFRSAARCLSMHSHAQLC